jgi:hypothetical protein
VENVIGEGAYTTRMRRFGRGSGKSAFDSHRPAADPSDWRHLGFATLEWRGEGKGGKGRKRDNRGGQLRRRDGSGRWSLTDPASPDVGGGGDC